MDTAGQPTSVAESRRGFLKKGIFGGLILAVGGAGFLASRRSRTVPLPTQGLEVLDPAEYSVLMAIAARLVPDGEGFPSAQEVGVGLNADRILARTDPAAAKEVKQLLRLFENALAGFIFAGRIRPFTRLAPPDQDEVLGEWQSSRLEIRRTGFTALRTLVLASYFGSPASWPAVHYPGPPPGFHQPDAPAWRGGGETRPEGNGVFHREASND
jgi:hypothetical protein